MDFRYVPAGDFTMGWFGHAEELLAMNDLVQRLEAPHNVRIKKGFYIQLSEVTNEQFRRFTAATGYDGGEQGKERFLQHLHDPEYMAFRDADKPVVFVSWNDAEAFCEWLSKADARVYRLPTEEEWEYVCKAGGDENFCRSLGKQLEEYAWFAENAGGHTHRVATRKPSPLGVHDMLGNVWEWTSSLFSPELAEESELGSEVIHIRGGSFESLRGYCRSSLRWAGWPPSKRDQRIGFRLLCENPRR